MSFWRNLPSLNPKAVGQGTDFTMRFDLADLSLFRHVVEGGSITGGATRAHLALAAASTRIRNMEEALGAALLVRGRQGISPTQAGRTLLQHARTMLRQAERLREDLGAYAGGLAGQIRVLSNTNALTEFLPEALSSFLAAHPNVSVDLEERLSDEIVGLIAEGVADLGIVAGTVDVSTLETYSFRKDRFVLETTARRVARTMAIAVVDLTDPWAVRELTICIRHFSELPPYASQLVEHLRSDAT